ncbi:LEAF RUST 10 DISEASE-RESISTANCE LOCUS RECEPTOR-LIKE PROTEIN KINASE-like 2.1 [Bienertia sinuspersici]
MVRKITDNFKHKLGEGGFAIVYKGKECDGRHVEVKLLKQSKSFHEDFINEVVSISRTNHVNVVSLLGFCFEGNKRALIYKFMPNGSLEKYAYHVARDQELPLETLFNIAVSIARGLDYLHRGCNTRILHFDNKPHNILLDEEFRPKISDFGLARLCPHMKSSISSLRMRGTIGYIAPEVYCRAMGIASHKSDVYSFEILIIDIVCGRKNIDSSILENSSNLDLPAWIHKRHEDENEEICSS